MPTEIITEEEQLARAGFLWRERGGVRALTCAPLEEEGFANAFPARTGGVSAFPENSLSLAGFDADAAENIYENRRRLLGLFEGEWALAVCWQVHGTDVHAVETADDSSERPGSGHEGVRCDALVTRTARVLVGVKTADCVPVLLGDAHTGAVAAVHAGWRGTLAGIVGRALEQMSSLYGTRPGDVRAALGPAALGCCYEVGPEVIEAFRQNFADADTLFTPTADGRALVDLHEANRRQLLSAGLSPARVHAAPLCTICHTDLFFSHRREHKLQGRTGRTLSVIGSSRR
ncbi:MAG TPA: peptidoglycan editing factor PgeF [Pyrinomonadaceae bacterium]|nr:peptidoglycan editing factor PgeF [Pyrinomonadaceae bacterium]